MARNLVEMGKGATYIAQQLNICRAIVYKIKHEIHLDEQAAIDI